MNTRNEAFIEGLHAYRTGAPLSDNPYRLLSAESADWEGGWLTGLETPVEEG